MNQLPKRLNFDDQISWNIEGLKKIKYSVSYADSLFNKNNKTLVEKIDLTITNRQQVIIIDSNVDAIYGQSIREYYENFNVEPKFAS